VDRGGRAATAGWLRSHELTRNAEVNLFLDIPDESIDDIIDQRLRR